MVNEIAGVDIGNPLTAEQIITRRNYEASVGGGLTYWQNLYSPSIKWRISGYLKAPTTTAVNKLLSLQHGQPVLIDLHSRWPGFITWGRVTEIRPRPSRRGNIFYYDMMLNEIPAIGVTYLHTAEAYLHDLEYQVNHRVFSPLSGRFAKAVTGDRMDWTWQFYLDNDKAAPARTLTVEFQVGDDITNFKIWGMKAAGWTVIGDWEDAGATVWDDPEDFIDDQPITHVFTVSKGERGDVEAAGTISQMLGLKTRVIASVTLMQAQGAADLSTDHQDDQILLRVTAEHTLREAARPYPVLTYVDGSLDYGRA